MSAQNFSQKIITTQFSRKIWNPVRKAIRDYQLIQPGDHIAVCISGGKDSMLLACALTMLQKISDIPFQLTGLSMDPGYTSESRVQIEHNIQKLGLETVWYETRLFETVNRETDNPCFMCSRLRRGSLYAKAQALGCNKIALGHHFDDVIETTLLSMLYGGQVQTMLPKLHAKNYPGMQVIRPLYLVRERDILAWRDACRLTFLACSCAFAANARRENRPESSKRYEVKQIIAHLERNNDQVAKNIFNSVKNVNVDDILGWHKGAERHSFLDGYDAETGWAMCRSAVTDMGSIRRAEERDISQLKDIYNEAVLHTTATFDTEVKDDIDRKAWFDAHQGRYLLLVYEENDRIAGYASLSRYHERQAFDTTVEISVYIHPDYRSRHIGTQLMRAVLAFARERDDIETVVSLITSDNAASIHLHEAFGFTYCGQIRNAGIKFGRRLHLNIYEITYV